MWLEDKLYKLHKYLHTTNETAFQDNRKLGDETKSRGYPTNFNAHKMYALAINSSKSETT
jgi:hypothetical protein